MKSVSTILALIVSLCSIAQADVTCELMTFTNFQQTPKITPLKGLNGDKEYLFAEDTNVLARVIILPDESVEALLQVNGVHFSTDLIFKTESSRASVQSFYGKNQVILGCVKK